MKTTEILEIEGLPKLKIEQWGARQQARMFVVLSRFLGGRGVKMTGLSVESVTSLLVNLGSEDDLTTILDALAESTTKESGKDGTGKPVFLPIDWDKLFAGRMIALARWLVAGLGLNYSDFLTAWASLNAAAQNLQKRAEPETSTSPLTSSDG